MSELLTPKLRFPKFDDNWSTHNLSEISEQIKRKKEDISSEDNILTISANKGFISQKERWDNVIAGGSLKKYTYLKQNEFSYNRGNSKSFKFGCIYKLNNYKNALVPNVYHSFKITYGNTDFFEQLFKSKILDKQLIKMITSTARMDGLLNISAKNFFNINVNFPNDLKEQEKIGSFLKTIDTKIILLEQKYDNYLNFKKYLMQQIFTQKLRFNFSDEWKIVKLESLIKKGKAGGTPSSTNSDYYNGDIPFLSIRDMTEQGKYILKTEKTITEEGLNNSSAWIIPKNSLLYSIYASIGLVAINRSDISTSQAIYGIILKEGVSLEYMYYYLTYFKKNIHKYIETGTQGNLNAKLLKSFEILLPSLEEQEMIVNVLSIVDEKIENSKKEIEKINEFKKGLLQQMFI